jgi:hypothetical protein
LWLDDNSIRMAVNRPIRCHMNGLRNFRRAVKDTG